MANTQPRALYALRGAVITAKEELRKGQRRFRKFFQQGIHDSKLGRDIGRGSELWLGMTTLEKEAYEIGREAYFGGPDGETPKAAYARYRGRGERESVARVQAGG